MHTLVCALVCVCIHLYVSRLVMCAGMLLSQAHGILVEMQIHLLYS